MDIVFEPDFGVGPFHRKVVETRPIPNTRTGSINRLECGHVTQSFGDMEHARRESGEMMVLCMACRDAAVTSY
jgi:hypothetical protein